MQINNKRDKENVKEKVNRYSNLFRPKHRTLVEILANGNPQREIALALRGLQIFHFVCLCSVAIAVLLLYVVIPMSNFEVYSGDITQGIWLFYVFSIFVFCFGLRWPSEKTKRKYFENNYSGLTDIHTFRTLVFFELIVFLAFILGILGAKWYLVCPLLLLSLAGLIITFPTKKRWNLLLENTYQDQEIDETKN